MTFNRAHAPAGSSKGIREHAAAMKSHGLRLRGKQTVAARPAMAAMARVPPFVEGARMPSLAARPDAKAAKAVAPTGASTPCAGGGPRVEGGCRGPDVAEVRFIVIYIFSFIFTLFFISSLLHQFEVQEDAKDCTPDGKRSCFSPEDQDKVCQEVLGQNLEATDGLLQSMWTAFATQHAGWGDVVANLGKDMPDALKNQLRAELAKAIIHNCIEFCSIVYNFILFCIIVYSCCIQLYTIVYSCIHLYTIVYICIQL